MLYHDVSQVSIFGLHGLLHVQEAVDAEAVSVQIDGPYQAKVVDDSWLLIYPQGHEPPVSSRAPSDMAVVSPILRRYYTDLTIGQTNVGSVAAAFKVQFLTDPGPPMKTRAPARSQAIARIAAPHGIKFELIGCYGLCKDPHGWRYMDGDSQFDS
jgi:hypothetical protein